MKLERIILYSAFPKYLESDIDILWGKFSFKTTAETSESQEINLGNEVIYLPYRIYLDTKEFDNLSGLTDTQLQILSCILTRNHDGYVRQRFLMNILNESTIWSAPYVMQLMGEYIIEILRDIYTDLSEENIANLKTIIKMNPDFYQKTKARIYSYMDCYYRNTFQKKEDYVGIKILHELS